MKKRLIIQYPGNTFVYYYDGNTKKVFVPQKIETVELCDELIEELGDIIGETNVKVK